MYYTTLEILYSNSLLSFFDTFIGQDERSLFATAKSNISMSSSSLSSPSLNSGLDQDAVTGTFICWRWNGNGRRGKDCIVSSVFDNFASIQVCGAWTACTLQCALLTSHRAKVKAP